MLLSGAGNNSEDEILGGVPFREEIIGGVV